MKLLTPHKSQEKDRKIIECSTNDYYRKGLPFENEAKKRLRLQEIKDFDCGKKCLSPSIFRKNKVPLLFGIASSNSNPSSIASDSTSKSIAIGSKKVENIQGFKESNQIDFDINHCLDQADVHCKHTINN